MSSVSRQETSFDHLASLQQSYVSHTFAFKEVCPTLVGSSHSAGVCSTPGIALQLHLWTDETISWSLWSRPIPATGAFHVACLTYRLLKLNF